MLAVAVEAAFPEAVPGRLCVPREADLGLPVGVEVPELDCALGNLFARRGVLLPLALLL